jgi:potassium efflux system protein
MWLRSKAFILILLLVWSGVLSLSARAAITDAFATSAEGARPASDETLAKLRGALESQQREAAGEAARYQRAAGLLQQSIAEAPATIELLRKDIARAAALFGTARIEKMTLQQLDARLGLLESQLRALDIALSDVYEKIADQQNVPTSARNKITTLQLEEAEAERIIESQKNAAADLDRLRRDVAVAQRERLGAERKYHEIQLEGFQRTLEVLTANRDLLTAQLAAIQDAYDDTRARFDELRKDDAARKQAAFDELEEAIKGMPTPVIDAALTNRKYNDEILVLESGLRETTLWNKQINDVIQELRQRYQIAQQQLDIGGYNHFYMDHVRYVTRDVRPLLNQYGDADSLRAALVESRAKQFSYDEQLRELRNYAERQKKIVRVLDRIPSEVKTDIAITAEIQRIYAQREQLLARLSQVNGNYVVAVTTYELARKQLETEVRKFNTMLNRKLTWLHSSPPMTWDVLLKAPEGAFRFFAGSPWLEVPHYLDTYRTRHPLRTAFAFILLGALVYSRRKLLGRLAGMKDKIGRVGRDTFRHTLEALAVTLVAALPVPLLLYLVGVALMTQSPYQSFAYTLADPFLRMGQIALVLAVISLVIREDGLGPVHFRWDARIIRLLQLHVRSFAVQIPVYMLGLYLVNNAGDQKLVFIFARVLLLTANLALAWSFWHLLRPEKGLISADEYAFFDAHWRQRYLWMPIVVGIPAVCAGLLAWGYDFSVVSIARLFFTSLFAGFGIYLAHQVLTRWFAVQERRIAYDRALARRAAAQAAKAREDVNMASMESVPDVEAVDEINLESISEHNRGLLKILASAAMLTTFWHLWSDLAPALDVLDKIVLWNMTDVAENGDATQVAVTLWSVLCALLVLVVMVVSGRNLPGLVEVVLLQRFHMEKSIRFAITTVATYCIYAVGLMVASSLLGIEWQKVGWLVAALGVGLGFGLQEIFANFVSGIIILIERPIRIGDAVTIEGQSGMVTQIRMRSTTVTDWDLKELIIPNKAIVTSQLVNWTLSDSATRVVIPVGVEYGTDPRMVIKSLLKAAEDNALISRDRPPGAFFLGFGESTLNFELRVFVTDFPSRLQVLHELNMAINDQFVSADIQMAFRQLDVRVKEFPVSMSSIHGA